MIDEIADRAETVQDEIDKIAAANQEQADKIEDVMIAVEDLKTLEAGADGGD
jgi:methyl-accepting chemotaxis protein